MYNQTKSLSSIPQFHSTILQSTLKRKKECINNKYKPKKKQTENKASMLEQSRTKFQK